MKEREYRGPDSRAVRQMFGGIAHRYDFLNHVLSASIDRRWRRIAVSAVPRSAKLCLDLCSGTGDLAIELHRRLGAKVVAADFCHPMLTRSGAKVKGFGLASAISIVESDALALPFSGESFDALTIAFGLRNLEDPLRGLAEIRRVLRPGGTAVILEFSRPVVPVFREAFAFYFRVILPRIGAAISGSGGAYRYLPESVQRFPNQTELAALMQAAGFEDVGYRNLTGGVAALHVARRPKA